MKKLIVIISILFTSILGLSQDTNLTKEQLNYIDHSSKIDTVEAYITYVGNDDEPLVVIYGDEVRVLFTLEQVQKINNQYRMVELLENVIDKYGLETDIDVGVINSMEEEIFLLNEKLKIVESRIENKDMVIKSLEETIRLMEEKDANNALIHENLEEQSERWEKEAKKQKRQKIFVAIGGGLLLILVVVASI